MLSNLLNLAVTGRPEVTMWCSTPWVVGGKRPSSLITEENSAKSAFSSAVLEGGGFEGEEVEGGEVEGGEDEGEEAEGGEQTVTAATAVAGCCSRKVLAVTSTSRLKCCRKSTPIILKSTAASRKFQEKRRPPKAMVSCRLPQHGICWPFAALSLGPVGCAEDLKGMMLKEEPVSTRKEVPLFLSTMWTRLPGLMAPTTPQLSSFPARSRGPGRNVPCPQKTSGRSTALWPPWQL